MGRRSLKMQIAMSDILGAELAALEAEGMDKGDLAAGSISSAVAYASAAFGPEIAAALCDRAAAELRGEPYA